MATESPFYDYDMRDDVSMKKADEEDAIRNKNFVDGLFFYNRSDVLNQPNDNIDKGTAIFHNLGNVDKKVNWPRVIRENGKRKPLINAT